MSANVRDLANELNDVYRNYDVGRKSLGVFLFGIKYADELHEHGIKDILKRADIGSVWHVELNKARNIGEELKSQGVNISRLKL